MAYSSIRKHKSYCRWCGIVWTPAVISDRDGFCCTAHKQAHHRAYSRYRATVTPPPAIPKPRDRGPRPVVTTPMRRRRP